MASCVGIVLYLWFMGYYDNTEIREKIDSLLRVNAAIQASVGTKSKHDVGGYKQARDIWIQLLYEIRVLDEEYYRLLATPEEQRDVERLGIVIPSVI
jgi:predicted membrane chloride channel (bestrophin family)